MVFGRGATDVAFPVALELADLDDTNSVTVRGLDEKDSFGRHVVLANVNGDAYADLVVTAPGGDPHGRTDAGETYVFFGGQDIPVGGVLDTLAIASGDGTKGFVINGIDALDNSGGGTAFSTNFGKGLSAGDFNGDGVDDLAIGTRGGDPPEANSEAYVIFGGDDIIPPPPAPSFSIDDVAVAEGDSGTASATFTVVRSGDTTGTDEVAFATADGTATTADNDYLAASGTLTFDPGVITMPVTVVGDTSDEGDETFFVNLTNPSTGVTISDASGLATIANDDAILTSLYIADIQFESKRGGKDWRATVQIRSGEDGSLVEGVTLQVDFAGETYTLVTDSNGLAWTSWERNLADGEYYADAYDLALEGYEWSPFSLDLEDDSDGDGKPDDLLVVA